MWPEIYDAAIAALSDHQFDMEAVKAAFVAVRGVGGEPCLVVDEAKLRAALADHQPALASGARGRNT